MGQTLYCSTSSTIRSASRANFTSTEIFTQQTINDEMNPKGLAFRESRDSDVHPNSVPIIVGLDETGSMGHIPLNLTKGGLTKIMDGIINNGIPDPQILFIGFGDHECDSSPLQVGQFESGDELLDKWLTSVYLEGCGGGNGGESYFLPWYVGARYTRTDHWDKRKKKGYLFTIGDEPMLSSFPAKAQERIMGNGQYTDLTATQILKEATEKWQVYHIHVASTYQGSLATTQGGWKQLLGDHCIIVDSHEKVASTIARIVAENEAGNSSNKVKPTEDQKESEANKPDPYAI